MLIKSKQFLFLIFIFILYVWMFGLHSCHVPHVYLLSVEKICPEEDIGYSETEVMLGCELPCES